MDVRKFFFDTQLNITPKMASQPKKLKMSASSTFINELADLSLARILFYNINIFIFLHYFVSDEILRFRF